MRSALLLTLTLSCASLSWGQSPTPAPATATPSQTATNRTGGAIEKRTEHIRVEDAGSRIDELRIGGVTKSIDVQPKGGMPAYQIAPTGGERSWKVVDF
jgi:hypothetical protein